MSDPLIPDWSCWLTRAGTALKGAENAALERDWDAYVDSLCELRKYVDQAFYWQVKREVVERSPMDSSYAGGRAIRKL